MASPHVPDDLIQPNGLLTFGLFPNLSNAPLSNQSAWQASDLYALLNVFLIDGYARAASIDTPTQDRLDAAALAWAYSRAYLVIWQRLSANPATVAVEGQVSQTYTQAQIATFQTLSQSYLRDHESFFLLATGEASKTVVIANFGNDYAF